MAEPFNDRPLVLKILRRFVEILHEADTLEKYDRMMNPEVNPKMLVKTNKKIIRRVERQCLLENGVDPGVLEMPFMVHILSLYGADQEVMGIIEMLMDTGPPVTASELDPGDIAPNVGLVSIETQQIIQMENLWMNKERPLVVIAGSLS
ncbi:uncharacterized protein LOC100366751 [Saccoglossus kowalevskii]